jgi:ABC-type phosphate transport system auxiliary subunit
MEGMVINKIKKIAELILLKDKEYSEIEKLKEYLKKYIDLNNEIGILEDTLKDLDNNSNTLNINDAKFLSNELRKYLNTLNKLRCQLNELNSNVNVVNYDELNECIKKMRNIVVNVDDSLKWDIYNKIDELKKELETVEWELELIILNYGLQKFEIDDNDNNEELYDYIYQKIIQHLTNLDEK